MLTPISVDVDILVANYNNAPYLSTFFDSVVNSTVWPRKLIIVNDGSPDNSEQIIRTYAAKYSFILPIYLQQNVGFANALNVGINYLESTYTIRIDPDDYMYPNRIAEQYEFISKNDYDIVGTNIQYFDSLSGKNLCKSNVSCDEVKIMNTFKVGACGIIHGSSIIKTSHLKNLKYIQNNVPAEDYDLFSKILLNGGKAINIPDTLTAVRVHMNSVSNFLPLTTIQKTFDLTAKLWGIHYNSIYVRVRYIHLKYYRLFLFERNIIKRLFYLSISCLFAPGKVIRRIFG